MTMRPVGETVRLIEDAGFEVINTEAMRPHYVRTIRAWLGNFEAKLAAIREILTEEQVRVWRLYLAGGALAFEEGRMGVDQILAVRPQRGTAQRARHSGARHSGARHSGGGIPAGPFVVTVLSSAAALLVMMGVTFAVALKAGKHSVVDTAWGIGIAVVALVSLLASIGHGQSARRYLLLAAAVLWGLRLAAYIGWRNHGKPRTRATATCSAAPRGTRTPTRSGSSTCSRP